MEQERELELEQEREQEREPEQEREQEREPERELERELEQERELELEPEQERELDIIAMKKDNESNFVTELKVGESVETDGPARFTVLDVSSSGHKNRAKSSIIADKKTRIKKLIHEAADTAKKWGLL